MAYNLPPKTADFLPAPSMRQEPFIPAHRFPLGHENVWTWALRWNSVWHVSVAEHSGGTHHLQATFLLPTYKPQCETSYEKL